MPNYKGHLAGGLVAYIIFLFLIIGICPSLVTGSEWLLCTLAGALFPDVDTKSKGQKYFYSIIVVLFVFLGIKRKFQLLSAISFIILLPMLVNHRGMFHSFWFVVGMPLYAWLGVSLFFPHLSHPLFFNIAFFIAGGLSHIILDRGIVRLFTNKKRKR